jgi:multisubunit Na+/H+ antiporter MnhF subunit
MEIAYKIILIIHIVGGSVALLSGLLAIIFRNNVKKHKPIGKIYFWAMTVIFFSAIFMSVYKSNIFLFCVSFFTYYACLTAYRSLKLKKLHLDQKPNQFDWAIEVFFGLMHIGFIIFAIMVLRGPNMAMGIISMVFGVLGIRGNYVTLQRFRKKLVYKNYWLLAHIGGMLGSYIGAITAFTVNNGRWLPAPDLVLWLGPTVFLVPLIIFETNKHQKKAGKFKTA